MDHRERVVRGTDLSRLVAAHEHRELGDPEHVDARVVVEMAHPTEVVADGAERGVHHARTVRDHEHAVADLCAGGRADRVELLGAEELRDAPLPAVGALPEVGEPSGLRAARHLGQRAFDVAAAEIVAALDADALHDAAGGDRFGEHPESRGSDDAGEVAQEELEARVGLVDPVAVHGLPPGHPRERHREMATAKFAGLPCASGWRARVRRRRRPRRRRTSRCRAA